MRFTVFVTCLDHLVINRDCISFDFDMILLPDNRTSTTQPEIGAVTVVGDKIFRMIIQLINSGLTNQHHMPMIIDVHDQGMRYLSVTYYCGGDRQQDKQE